MSMYSAKGRGKLLPKATNKEYGVVKGGGDVEITNKGEIKIRAGAVEVDGIGYELVSDMNIPIKSRKQSVVEYSIHCFIYNEDPNDSMSFRRFEAYYIIDPEYTSVKLYKDKSGILPSFIKADLKYVRREIYFINKDIPVRPNTSIYPFKILQDYDFSAEEEDILTKAKLLGYTSDMQYATTVKNDIDGIPESGLDGIVLTGTETEFHLTAYLAPDDKWL